MGHSDTNAGPDAHDPKRKKRLALLSLAALGVVYGDIGTSPLYALRECFHGEYAIAPSGANVLGVLSLMFWTLAIVVSLKYLGVMLRADNRGEGGVIALMALAAQAEGRGRKHTFVLGLGLFAASLLYGDGMITPAISVLSAVEGLEGIAPEAAGYVHPITIGILVGLFLFQRRGTAGVGALFGPITMIWFATLAVMGLEHLLENPRVLAALNPWYGLEFLLRNGRIGFMVLGAVFLVATGAEALYADLGHFGKRPIRLAWYGLALPSLLCNYFGQGSMLLRDPQLASDVFYSMAPEWFLTPLVILATMATIIASQAVISGAFSLTRQAIQMGFLPRMRIRHTSDTEEGQIYIPSVNWILMLSTIVLVLIFGSSSKLAAAYGVAVTTTMLIASLLLGAVARHIWNWSRAAVGALIGLFLVVDVSFFLANIGKITHGAWIPLAIGGVAFLIMQTWKKGRAVVRERLYGDAPDLDELLARIRREDVARVPGYAVFMAGTPHATPPALRINLAHNHVLHENVIILTIRTANRPTVARDDKVEVRDLGAGFSQVLASYGFMEEPRVPHVLALARDKGLDAPLEDITFFVGREELVHGRRPSLPRWRRALFLFMTRNARPATSFFNVPPKQVVELGQQVEI